MPSSIFRRLLPGLALVIVLLGSSLAHARIWKDFKGEELEAEFVRKEGSMVTLLVNGQEKTFPISYFSPLDKTYISQQKNRPAPEPTPETTPNTPTVPENTTPTNPNTPMTNAPTGAFRIWRSVDGRSVRARYVSYNPDTKYVTLELDNGQRQAFPLNDFSFADKEEVNRQVVAAAQPGEPATPIIPATTTTQETPETSSTEPQNSQETARPRTPRNSASGESWARFVHRRKGGPAALASVPAPSPVAPQPGLQQPTAPQPTTPAPTAPQPMTPAPAPVVTTGQPLMNQVTYGESSDDSNPMMMVAIVLVIAAAGAFAWSRTRG